MTDKKSSESRRKLLKSIAAGSGAIVAGKSLPESWSRPVVESVLLPAHAQTSTAPACTITVLVAGIPDGSSAVTQNTSISGTITPNPGADVSVLIELDFDGVFSGNTTSTTTDASGNYAWPTYFFGSTPVGTVEALRVTASPSCSGNWSATHVAVTGTGTVTTAPISIGGDPFRQ